MAKSASYIYFNDTFNYAAEELDYNNGKIFDKHDHTSVFGALKKALMNLSRENDNKMVRGLNKVLGFDERRFDTVSN